MSYIIVFISWTIKYVNYQIQILKCAIKIQDKTKQKHFFKINKYDWFASINVCEIKILINLFQIKFSIDNTA